jgi:hypothetical protein
MAGSPSLFAYITIGCRRAGQVPEKMVIGQKDPVSSYGLI